MAQSWFFEPSDNSNQKSFPSPPSDTVILVTPDFSKYPIFRTNFRFPLRFEKFGFNCNFGMIIRLLDVRIGSVFIFNAIWVRLYNTCFRAWCTFFRAIRSPPPPPPPPQVQRCPYAYVSTLWFNNTLFSGLEGYQEQRDMKWGDVERKETANGTPFWGITKDSRRQEQALIQKTLVL